MVNLLLQCVRVYVVVEQRRIQWEQTRELHIGDKRCKQLGRSGFAISVMLLRFSLLCLCGGENWSPWNSAQGTLSNL